MCFLPHHMPVSTAPRTWLKKKFHSMRQSLPKKFHHACLAALSPPLLRKVFKASTRWAWLSTAAHLAPSSRTQPLHSISLLPCPAPVLHHIPQICSRSSPLVLPALPSCAQKLHLLTSCAQPSLPSPRLQPDFVNLATTCMLTYVALTYAWLL
jgi:hypothetical protein